MARDAQENNKKCGALAGRAGGGACKGRCATKDSAHVWDVPSDPSVSQELERSALLVTDSWPVV